MRTYIGIDNGLDGGLVALNEDGDIIGQSIMPTTKLDKGREVDADGILRFVTGFDGARVMIESASKHSPGKLALCSTWYSFGITKATVMLALLPCEIITPQKWQRTFWKRPSLPKGEKFDTKAAALKAADQIWPDHDWRKSKRATKAHDGLVDAALIAQYHRLNHG